MTFNKRAQPAQTDPAFTVPAEDIAALKAGLYNFSVQAFPREDDIYYVKSEAGVASLAIQPKGGAGEVVTVTKNWDFSLADWQAEFAKLGAANTDITNCYPRRTHRRIRSCSSLRACRSSRRARTS